MEFYKKQFHIEDNTDFKTELANNEKTVIQRQKWAKIEKEQINGLTPIQRQKKFIEIKNAERGKL